MSPVVIYLRDLDSIILGQVWKQVFEDVSLGILGQWWLGTYWIQTTVG